MIRLDTSGPRFSGIARFRTFQGDEGVIEIDDGPLPLSARLTGEIRYRELCVPMENMSLEGSAFFGREIGPSLQGKIQVHHRAPMVVPHTGYSRTARGWERYSIEPSVLPMEAYREFSFLGLTWDPACEEMPWDDPSRVRYLSTGLPTGCRYSGYAAFRGVQYEVRGSKEISPVFFGEINHGDVWIRDSSYYVPVNRPHRGWVFGDGEWQWVDAEPVLRCQEGLLFSGRAWPYGSDVSSAVQLNREPCPIGYWFEGSVSFNRLTINLRSRVTEFAFFGKVFSEDHWRIELRTTEPGCQPHQGFVYLGGEWVPSQAHRIKWPSQPDHPFFGEVVIGTHGEGEKIRCFAFGPGLPVNRPYNGDILVQGQEFRVEGDPNVDQSSKIRSVGLVRRESGWRREAHVKPPSDVEFSGAVLGDDGKWRKRDVDGIDVATYQVEDEYHRYRLHNRQLPGFIARKFTRRRQ